MIRFRKQLNFFLRFRWKGFSLLEILIALAVMLVGIVGVTMLFPVGLRASKMGETYTRSALLGQQIIEWLKTYTYAEIDDGTGDSNPPPSGTENIFTWELDIYNVTDDPYDINSAPYNSDLQEIIVTIKWQEGGSQRMEHFYSYISRY